MDFEETDSSEEMLSSQMEQETQKTDDDSKNNKNQTKMSDSESIRSNESLPLPKFHENENRFLQFRSQEDVSTSDKDTSTSDKDSDKSIDDDLYDQVKLNQRDPRRTLKKVFSSASVFRFNGGGSNVPDLDKGMNSRNNKLQRKEPYENVLEHLTKLDLKDGSHKDSNSYENDLERHSPELIIVSDCNSPEKSRESILENERSSSSSLKTSDIYIDIIKITKGSHSEGDFKTLGAKLGYQEVTSHLINSESSACNFLPGTDNEQAENLSSNLLDSEVSPKIFSHSWELPSTSSYTKKWINSNMLSSSDISHRDVEENFHSTNSSKKPSRSSDSALNSCKVIRFSSNIYNKRSRKSSHKLNPDDSESSDDANRNIERKREIRKKRKTLPILDLDSSKNTLPRIRSCESISENAHTLHKRNSEEKSESLGENDFPKNVLLLSNYEKPESSRKRHVSNNDSEDRDSDSKINKKLKYRKSSE